MKLSGNGNLQGASAPIIKNTTGLKVYSALKKNESSTSQNFWNQITFEQLVIPLDKKLKQVGPFIYTFFDPNTGKYQLLKVPAIPISVKSNPKYKGDSFSAKPSPQLTLAPIKREIGTMYLSDWQLIKQSLFWFCQLLPLLLLIGAILYRRNAELMQSDSPKARAIRSANLARQQMAAAQSLSNEGRYDDLLEHLHLTLREYLGERFNLAAAGMTGSVVKTLADKGVPNDILINIQQFFEQYDMNRFTHTNFKQEEAMHLWETINSVIAAIDTIDINKLKPVSKGKELNHENKNTK
jgi:hypothetical protein